MIEARTVPIHRLVGRTAVGIGTDWAASDNAMDMLGQARLAALVGKQLADDPAALPVRTMLRLATIEGARVLLKLGDSVTTRVARVHPTSMARLIDLEAFRARIETVAASAAEPTIAEFLEAWRRADRGERF